MSSMITKPQRYKQQLGELLRQKQEPFVLDLYLFERGYLKKSLSSNLDSNRHRCPNKFSTTLIIPSCSRILRALLKKLTRRNDAKSCGRRRRDAKFGVNEQNIFLSASSTTVFNMCSESDKDESSPTSSNKYYDSVIIADTLEGLRLSNMTEEEQACPGREFQCQVMANINKQRSRVSVLEQIPQSKLRSRGERDTTCTVRLPNKLAVVDSSSTTLSASLCQLHSHESNSDKSTIRTTSKVTIANDDPMKLVGSFKSPSPQYATSKKMLQETRQLLFDCVKEIVETNAINRNGSDEKAKKCHRGLVGPEELGSLILERMKAWDSHIGNESNNASSSLDSNIAAEEWETTFGSEKRELCSEIGDSIVEAIVNEIVAEILV